MSLNPARLNPGGAQHSSLLPPEVPASRATDSAGCWPAPGAWGWEPPPELAPPELAPPELAPPELATPELATPELVPPELVSYSGQKDGCHKVRPE